MNGLKQITLLRRGAENFFAREQIALARWWRRNRWTQTLARSRSDRERNKAESHDGPPSHGLTAHPILKGHRADAQVLISTRTRRCNCAADGDPT